MEHQQKNFWEAIDRVKESDFGNFKIDQNNGELEQPGNEALLTIQKATELSVWLHTEFQCKMEEADTLMQKTAEDEQKPFEEKYQAREILQNLRKNEYLSDKYTKMPAGACNDAENLSENDSIQSQSQGSDVMRCALGLVMYKLGINFYDSEEAKEALVYLKKSFELMDSITDQFKLRHLNTIQDLYNYIALALSAFGDKKQIEEALKYLEKANEVYKLVSEHTVNLPQKSILNNFDLYLLQQINKKGPNSKNEKEPLEKSNFSFYINSGLDIKKFETNYTQTLFIMAQVYQNLDNVDEGLKYCAQTMKRQLQQNQYDIKDWVKNALGLADAYLQREHFAQAEYLLYAAYHLLPTDLKLKKKLRAMVQMQIGKYYQRRLEIGINLYVNGFEFDQEKINSRFVEFEELKLNWPEIKSIKSEDDAKTLFRLSNTQYKRALEYFVLDGFVTENVVIKQGQSALYKHLCKIEKDQQRREMMLQRRVELLEALQKELNPNTYQIRMMEFGAELSDIFGDLYEIEIKKPKKDANQINKIAEKCIQNSDFFTEIVYKKEDPQDKFEYLSTMLNLELTSCSKLTKWISQDGKEKIEKTKNAFDKYKKINQFINEYQKFKNLKSYQEIEGEQIQQQIKIILEMIELLPQKLDKMCAHLK